MMQYLHAQATITAHTIQRLSPRSFAKVIAIAYLLRPVTKHCALGLNAERSKTKGFACASWTLRNLAPPRASWKNPPYQVEAGPLEALNINQLQRRETHVVCRTKKKKTSPLIQIVNVKDKQMETAGTFLWPAPAAL